MYRDDDAARRAYVKQLEEQAAKVPELEARVAKLEALYYGLRGQDRDRQMDLAQKHLESRDELALQPWGRDDADWVVSSPRGDERQYSVRLRTSDGVFCADMMIGGRLMFHTEVLDPLEFPVVMKRISALNQLYDHICANAP